MKAVRFHRFGFPQVLKLEEVAVPQWGKSDLLVSVQYFAVNRADTLWRSMMYLHRPSSLPAGLGVEAMGVVEAVGESIKNFKKGDRVVIAGGLSSEEHPTYAEFLVAPASVFIKISEGISDQVAAASWLSSLTGYLAVENLKIREDSGVAVLNAPSSPTAIALMQILKSKGLCTVAITSSDDKKRTLLNLGYSFALQLNDPELVSALKGIHGGKGIDYYFDAVWGDGLNLIVEEMANDAKICVYGMLSERGARFPMETAIRKSISLVGFNVSKYLGHPVLGFPRNEEIVARATEKVGKLIATGVIKIPIDKIYEIQDVVAAHERMESGLQVGKILVKV